MFLFFLAQFWSCFPTLHRWGAAGWERALGWLLQSQLGTVFFFLGRWCSHSSSVSKHFLGMSQHPRAHPSACPPAARGGNGCSGRGLLGVAKSTSIFQPRSVPGGRGRGRKRLEQEPEAPRRGSRPGLLSGEGVPSVHRSPGRAEVRILCHPQPLVSWGSGSLSQ